MAALRLALLRDDGDDDVAPLLPVPDVLPPDHDDAYVTEALPDPPALLPSSCDVGCGPDARAPLLFPVPVLLSRGLLLLLLQ